VVSRIRRIEVVANIASGSVGPHAPAEVGKILADHGLQARICAPEPDGLAACLRDAVAADPDLLIILAGDGTARTAAELCGPEGPLLAPLAGGTMNMLPHAVYGVRSWREALPLMLDSGEEQMLGGGEVEGHSFLVAAILGSPALWAPAREAARAGRIGQAADKARQAFQRAFSGRLRYTTAGSGREKAEALTFMCPLVSRGLASDAAVLEVAALDVAGAVDAFRLGLHALVGDWRDDPAVRVSHGATTRVWAARKIPALLDGESVTLRSLTEVRYVPKMVRVLGLPDALRQ
jgi:diacylglycerol kinase family enzyme